MSFFRGNPYLQEMMMELKIKNDWRSQYLNSVIGVVRQLEEDPQKLGLALNPALKTNNMENNKKPTAKIQNRRLSSLDVTDKRFFNRERISSVEPSLLNSRGEGSDDDISDFYYSKVPGADSLKNWRNTPLFDTSSISRSNVEYRMFQEGTKVRVFYNYKPEHQKKYTFNSKKPGDTHVPTEKSANTSFQNTVNSTNLRPTQTTMGIGSNQDLECYQIDRDEAFMANRDRDNTKTPFTEVGFKDEVNEEKWEKSRVTVQKLKKLIEVGQLDAYRKKVEGEYLFKEERNIQRGLRNIDDNNLLWVMKMGFGNGRAQSEDFTRSVSKEKKKLKHTYLHVPKISENEASSTKKNRFMASLKDQIQSKRPATGE
jgi:hypothetical protein